MTSKKDVVVAVSGLHGVGKTSHARRLAESFGLRHVSGGMIFRNLALSRNISLLSLSMEAEGSGEIDRLIDGAVVEEGMKGNVVVDSMLCAWFLRDIADIKIFLFASEDVRVKRIALRDGRSFDESYRETIGRESSEIARFKKYYGVSMEDVKNACDLIMSTEDLSEDEVFSILKYYVEIRISKLEK
ncbi:MAG: (d)CMP kinase [Nitrososphaeria archaeon]